MDYLFGIDLVTLITAAGYAGLFAIIFAESGVLIGFFLPGDSLIFTAGFLASQGLLNIYFLSFLLFIAAVVGDSVGYAFGKKVGPKIFTRDDSLFFNKAHLERARLYYEAHGAKTIVFARFLPIIRTFVPILAGVGVMRYRTFVFYNIFGGFLWAMGFSWLGYFLGSTIPNVDRYLLPIIAVIIVFSFIPSIAHIMKNKSSRDQLRAHIVGVVQYALDQTVRKNKNKV